MTNLEKAVAILESGTKEGLSKKNILANIESSLMVSRSNASVYLYKAKKLIGSEGFVKPSEPVEIVEQQAPEVLPESEEEGNEFQQAMEQRQAAGLSTMSYSDWKNMVKNLESLSQQFA